MEQDEKKIKRSIKAFPLFSAFSSDLIFFVPIDTLFLTLVKGLNASQITAMTMVSLALCIILQKVILKIVEKIGNTRSLKLGAFMLLCASVILTFGTTFGSMLIYRCIYEIALLFLHMSRIVLKNNLVAINRQKDYYKIRNKAKIVYAIITMITALLAGTLFNVNNYLPMYLSILVYVIMLGISFVFYEANLKNEKQEEKKKRRNITSTIFLIILSNAVFYSIIKMGQNNSKLFMQYDFQEFLSIEMVTYYITTIVFLSRLMRLGGNIIFGKIYLKIKDKLSIVLSILLSMAFLLLILGHFLNIGFVYKVIIMSLGFFLILAIRDSFQVYIEDIALSIADKDQQQKMMIDIEIYRKIGTLILSTVFTLILMKFELIVIECILCLLAVIEIGINCKLCKKLSQNTKDSINI